MLDVYQYLDYRKLLKDLYQERKALNVNFSYRYISLKTGIRSSGYFANILSGKSNISLQLVLKLAHLFGMKRPEAEYFELLVLFNQAKTHDEIGLKLGILDFDRAAKVTGARFTFMLGMAARLERALISFMMDTHANEHGYREAISPYIVNGKSMYGTGNFPKFKEDVFHLSGSDYYLIPTAEVPMTNFYAGEILKEEQLPQRFSAFSACFRSEAGAYGRDTAGLIRQHQFHKVELMCFVHPDKSYEEHERLTANTKNILKKLN